MEASDAAAARFGLRDRVVLALEDPGGGVADPAGLAELARLSAALETVEGIVPGSVASLATVPRLYVEDGVMDLRPLVGRGGATPPGADTARRVRAETAAMGLDDGVLLAADGTAAGIYADVAPGADRYRLRAAIERLAAEGGTTGAGGGGRRIRYSGSALVQAALGEAAALDLVRLVPLVLLVVGVVIGLAHRHPAPALISLAEVGVSLVLTVGVMGALGTGVFVTTLALPVILVVIGVTDDVYALNRCFRLARRRPDRSTAAVAVEAFGAIRRPVVLTSVTTAAGLASLTATSIEPQRVFGAFGALAVVFSTLLTFTLVPALLVAFDVRAPRAARPRRLGAKAAAAALALVRRGGPRRLVAAAALGLLAAAGFATRLSIDDTWVRNLDPASELVRGDRAINRRLAGTNTLELMLDSGRPGGILEPSIFRAVGAVERALAAHSEVGAVDGVYREVVRLDAALAGTTYAARDTALAAGAALTATQIEQARLLLDSLGRSPLATRLDGERRRCRITVFVRGADYSKIGELVAVARRAAAPVFAGGRVVPFGDGWIGHRTVELLVVGQVRAIALALVSDTLLLVLLFRSLGTALLAMAPVALSVAAVFGLLGAAGVPLGTANSMFAAIALGIGVDYSIHLVALYRDRRRHGDRQRAVAAALHAAGPAILTSALAIAAGFAVLTGSAVLPNRQLGLLVALSLAVCALLTLVLVPALALAPADRPPGSRAPRPETSPVAAPGAGR
jgi:predicted RND superfamily exporter protein